MNGIRETAFLWIIDKLESYNIPYLICGGLAANAYGTNRPLNDIDIFVPERNFSKIVNTGKDYISYGPDRYRDQYWNVEYVQFIYDGQKIEIGSSSDISIHNADTSQWESLNINFDAYTLLTLCGRDVRVMKKADLITYKNKLAREVDKIDVRQLRGI